MNNKNKEVINLAMDCMLDIDATAARKAIQIIMDRVIDPKTHKVRISDASPSTCFKMTAEQLRISTAHFETIHPELRQYLG